MGTVSVQYSELVTESVSGNINNLFPLQPAVHIVCHRRSWNSVSKFGHNVGIEWKPDSSMLAVWVSYR